MRVEIKNRQQVVRYFRRVVGNLQQTMPFLLVWAQRVAKEARTTARSKGGRRFWSDLARSVRVQRVGPHGVSVHSTHVAAAQKQYGGEIRPKNVRALTIPISDEARGKRASEFESGGRELFVLDRDQGDTVGILGYSEGDQFHALFVLRTRVRQQPDPWFPGEARILRYGIDEADRWADRQLRRA